MTTDPGFETRFIRGVRRMLHSPLVLASAILFFVAAACLFAGETVNQALFVPAVCFTANAVLFLAVYLSSKNADRPLGTTALGLLYALTLVEFVGGTALVIDYLMLKYARFGVVLPVFKNGGIIPAHLPFDSLINSTVFSFIGIAVLVAGIGLLIFLGGLIKSIREGTPRAHCAALLRTIFLFAALILIAAGTAVLFFGSENSWLAAFPEKAVYAAGAFSVLLASLMVLISFIFPRYKKAAQESEVF